MDSLVIRREVKIKHEKWEFEDFEIDDDVPKNNLVVTYEVLVHENRITFLHQNIEELLVKCYWWQKRNRCSFSSIQIRILLLTINCKLRNKLLFAYWTLDRVIAQTFLET